MADVQDEVINSTNVKGQTSNNAFGALGTTINALDREIIRFIIQHNKSLDFSLLDYNRLERELNYQVWSFWKVMILEKHRIWTFCVNPKTQGVVPKVEHEGKKFVLDAVFESM
jgi:hypothetical protein